MWINTYLSLSCLAGVVVMNAVESSVKHLIGRGVCQRSSIMNMIGWALCREGKAAICNKCESCIMQMVGGNICNVFVQSDRVILK